jgi:NADH-quinone oxidoreductase subunit N
MGTDHPIHVTDWVAIYPELLLLVMTCVIALVDLWTRDAQRRTTYLLSLATLLGLALVHAMYFAEGLALYAMNGMVVVDGMSSLLKLFATLATAATLVYGRRYAADRGLLSGELFALALFALLGQYIIISGNNLLVIYMGLEAMSLSLYALVALRRDDAVATEAAMKYFVLGALASGFLLYGMSMLYGATGSLDLNTVFRGLASAQIHRDVIVLAVIFVVTGLAFKLSVVPFHMWAPDVYQGSPTVATLLIGGAPKLAALAMCLRLLVEGMLPMAVDWQKMLGVLAVGSLLLGNLAAIAQSDIKRMLAYSAIAQMGFMLLGLMSGVVSGNTLAAANAYSSAMFYVVTYVLTTLGTFGALMLMSGEGHEVAKISDLKGLNRRSPWLAAMMALMMFSLAGIPPMVGFYAKLAVLQALLQTGAVWLVVYAVLLSLVGAYYYIRIVKLMYFDEPNGAAPLPVMARDAQVLFSMNGAAVLLLGVFPGALMGWCAQAIVHALST